MGPKAGCSGTSLVVQWVGLHAHNAGGARVRSLAGELDPTCMPQLRVCMPQLRVCMLQLRVRMLQLNIPHAATKIWSSQNK